MTVRHHNKPTRMTKIKTTEPILNVDEDGEQLEPSDTARSINLCNHFQICRHYDLAISLSAETAGERCTYVSQKTLQDFSNQHYLSHKL